MAPYNVHRRARPMWSHRSMVTKYPPHSASSHWLVSHVEVYSVSSKRDCTQTTSSATKLQPPKRTNKHDKDGNAQGGTNKKHREIPGNRESRAQRGLEAQNTKSWQERSAHTIGALERLCSDWSRHSVPCLPLVTIGCCLLLRGALVLRIQLDITPYGCTDLDKKSEGLNRYTSTFPSRFPSLSCFVSPFSLFLGSYGKGNRRSITK